MICVELHHLQALLERLPVGATKDSLTSKTQSIADELCGALAKQVAASRLTQSTLPYEVDGFGAQYFMDDANVPSLLSLPLLGYLSSDHPVYEATRGFVLSEENPFFFRGTAAEGVGGPHVGFNYSWPMAIVTRAMTSSSVDEVKTCLDMLLASTAGTGFMHESFNVNNVADFTRTWFAWANGLFGELILQVILLHPELLIKEGSFELAQSAVQTPVSILAQQNTILGGK
jgi:meiotically up-regulated gene 157 (Mug157) protein